MSLTLLISTVPRLQMIVCCGSCEKRIVQYRTVCLVLDVVTRETVAYVRLSIFVLTIDINRVITPCGRGKRRERGEVEHVNKGDTREQV